jgi:hypothetical protein
MKGGLIGLSASLGQTSRNLGPPAQPMVFTGMPPTPDIVASEESSRKIAHEGRTHLGQSSRTPTAPAQLVLSPIGMCTTMIVEDLVEASVAVELSATASLGPSVPEFHAQPVFSPTGMHTTMDIDTLAEFPTVSTQPIPAEYTQNKESTTSVTGELSATDMGVIVQGNEPRDTFVFKEVYWRRDGSTTTLVNGTDFSFLKEGSVLCMEESVMEGSVADDLLGESSSCHPDSGGVSEGLPMTVGEVNEESESSPVIKELPLVKEISGFAGLSCDGQEGLQEECFKRILVEKHEKGGGSFHSTD